MSERAVNILREIREKNIQQIKSKSFEERQAFINRKVEETFERLGVVKTDEVKDTN